MKILFITQKIHENDDDLAFTILWVEEFIKQGFNVEVICLEKGDYSGSFPVHSLGKEDKVGFFGRVFRFLKLIVTLKYEKVFVHMNPEYITLGGWYWFLTGRPIFLWYTHYTMHFHLWLAGIFCKRLFAATKQSLPQFDNNPKKTVVGHGIDMEFWKGRNGDNTEDSHKLFSVHRICRSKRLELVIGSLVFLPKEYTLDVYGRDVEKDYYEELKRLATEKGLSNRVNFKGAVPMHELKSVYQDYRLMVNMASNTIDKTMLEVMLYGIYPITTPENSQAIGLPLSPDDETPEAIADFVLSQKWQKYNTSELTEIVSQKHNLKQLVKKLIQKIS